MASLKMSLKLLVNKKAQKVLFAEATKEFVDFLFHIFSLPLGTLIELLGSKQMVGCLGKLKESIDSFNGTYLQPGIEKDDIFHPKTAYNGNKFLLSNDASSFQESNASDEDLYRCFRASKKRECYHCRCHDDNICRLYVTPYLGATCPGCTLSMNQHMTVVIPENEKVKKNVNNGQGYVKEVVTYMVMDDLAVKPMSTISSVTLINSFGVKDLSQLEEMEVSFGKDEALKLLMASLKTDKVLSALYLNNHA